AGNLFIADSGNHCVRRLAPDGTITTVAGTGTPGFSGDRGPALNAQLNQPSSLAVDSQDNLFIVDRLNHRIRKVGGDGVISTVFGGGGGSESGVTVAQYYPASVAIDRAGSMFIADPL